VTTAIDTRIEATAWATANRTYLLGELERLRLRLHAEVLRRRADADDPLARYRQFVVSDSEAERLLRDGDAEPFADRTLDAADAELERVQAERRRRLLEAGAAPALDALGECFELTSFERAVIRMTAAPELDPSFERIYAYVQDDLTSRRPRMHLALSLYGGTGLDWLRAWDAFLPDAPLRRYALITVEPADGTLGVDARIRDYLLGINRLDERATEVLRQVPAARPAPSQAELVVRVAQLAGGDGERAQRLPVNLLGPRGCGKHAVARAASERLGLELYELDRSLLRLDPADRAARLRLLEREAALLGLAFYLDAAASGEDGDTLPVADGTLRGLGAPLFLGGTGRWLNELELLSVHVPKPDRTEQRTLWRTALRGIGGSINGELDDIAEQFDFGPEGIERAVRSARAHAPNGDWVSAEQLWNACRGQSSWTLDELAQRIEPCHGWDDIVLPDDVHAQLREIAAQVPNRAHVYGDWGFGTKLGRGRGIGVLFSGASGTGKTMAAEILAADLRLDLYRVDLAGVVNKYIGETEKNLRRLFDAAEEGGAILFFDEADALFGKRSEVRDSHDRYANIEVNYLLQRMESYPGLAILATNMKSLLDQAFARRLRFVVDFPFPDATGRTAIWRRVFPPEAEVDGLDLEFLSRLEIPGGNIKNVALNAAFLAASEHAPIRMTHVMAAAKREYAKIPKLVAEAEFGPYYGEVVG
jgi:hypothetical protein